MTLAPLPRPDRRFPVRRERGVSGRLSEYGRAWVRPSPAKRDAVHRHHHQSWTTGLRRLHPEVVATLRGIVGRMQSAGRDAVVLACTELPLVIDDAKCGCRRSIRRGLLVGPRFPRTVRGT